MDRKLSGIRLLEPNANRRGDLFAQLMGDLFLTLGYDDCRYAIHKAGREVDVIASHRTEQKQLVAECKAEQDPVGGAEINKFVGVLDAERQMSKDRETVGYFVSISGFRETAVQQELDLPARRLILIDGRQVIGHLVRGQLMVAVESAAELAGRCVQKLDLTLDDEHELVAHRFGWIWIFYFLTGRQRTHFVLVHADGQVLDHRAGSAVVADEKSTGGTLAGLKQLTPTGKAAGQQAKDVELAQRSYLDYIRAEYGEVTLEGLPADQEVGSRRLALESIFVPLHLVPVDERPPVEDGSGDIPSNAKRIPVGSELGSYSRLAILAPPGGGKSTLIKRLAVAYGFPQRRLELDDHLPDRRWLPLVIRCRQLDDLATRPVTEIIGTLADRAELVDHKEAFLQLIQNALKTGTALLLIDGLDELSVEGRRIAFVQQLRTFLAIYPAVSLVVTSREAGFRAVAGALSGVCRKYTIAELDEKDIQKLTAAWHREVVGNTREIAADARQLADTIWSTDRVRRLATNPLLLTTLLLVKRWVGELPRRRSILYGKAIEVLLMTWNVEAHEPIDLEEAVPQLAFLAFRMMSDGIQQVSNYRLTQILRDARVQMPDVLGFATISVTDFVNRIEERSSLLVQAGHTIENGTLRPVYEFKHLTFQEYLTAVAIVSGYVPAPLHGRPLVDLLHRYFNDSRWREVIPLAAVLSGRQVGPLVRSLIDETRASIPGRQKDDARDVSTGPGALLGQCIIDEVQLPPELAAEALEWVMRRIPSGDTSSDYVDIILGKYGALFRDLLPGLLKDAGDDLQSLVGAAEELATLDILSIRARPPHIGVKGPNAVTPSMVMRIATEFSSGDEFRTGLAALALMQLSFLSEHVTYSEEIETLISECAKSVARVLPNGAPYLEHAACWALAWLGERSSVPLEEAKRLLPIVLEIWREAKNIDLQRQAAWALWELPLLSRASNPLQQKAPRFVDFIRSELSSSVWKPNDRRQAAIIVGFYLGEPWSDAELADLIDREPATFDTYPPGLTWEGGRAEELLAALGPAAREVLEKRSAKREELARRATRTVAQSRKSRPTRPRSASRKART